MDAGAITSLKHQVTRRLPQPQENVTSLAISQACQKLLCQGFASEEVCCVELVERSQSPVGIVGIRARTGDGVRAGTSEHEAMG